MGKKKKQKKKKKIDKDTYRNRGVNCFLKEDYKQAIAEWKPLLRSESIDNQLITDLAEAYYFYGISLFKENNLEAAVSNLNNAIKLNPNKSLYIFHLGCFLHKSKQYKEAINTYKQALRLDPNNDQIICYLVLACLRIGQTREAINSLQRFTGTEKVRYIILAHLKENKIDECFNLLEDLNEDDKLFFKGIIYLLKNEVEKAIPLLKKASLVPIFNKIANYYLSIAYIHKHQFQESAQSLETSYKDGLKNSRIKRNLKTIYQKLGLEFIKEKKNSQAIDVWEKLLEIDSQNQEVKDNLCHAYYLEGNAAVKKNNINKAIDCWLRAEYIDNNNPDILHNLALAFDKIEKYQQANKYWIKVIQIWRKNLRTLKEEKIKTYLNIAYKHLGKNYLINDEVYEAISAYNSALAYDPKDYKTRLELAELYLYEEQVISAIKEFKEILKNNPDNIDALNGLGLSYNLNEQPGKAVICWEKAINLEFDNPIIKEHLSKAYIDQSLLLAKQDKFNEAISLIDRKDRYCGKDINSYLVKGFIYTTSNEIKVAEKYYQQAIRLKPEDHEIYLAIGVKYLDCKIIDKAEKYFKQAIKYSKSDLFVHFIIGMAFCREKVCEQSHNHFDLAIKKAPKLMEMPYRIGEALFEEMNCRKGAKIYLKIAAKMLPNNPEIHFKLGVLYMYDLKLEDGEKELGLAEKLARDVDDWELIHEINDLRDHYKQLVGKQDTLQGFLYRR